jgi:hypothetical protein
VSATCYMRLISRCVIFLQDVMGFCNQNNPLSISGASLTCLVNDVPTCLPSNNLCKFSPTGPTVCKHRSGSSHSLQLCKNNIFQEKLERCKLFLDLDYREIYGEYVYPEDDGYVIQTPKRAYRDRLYRLNYQHVLEANNKLTNNTSEGFITMLVSGLKTNAYTKDNILPQNYHEFHYFNINQSLCHDQVDQRLGARTDPCPESGDKQREDESL